MSESASKLRYAPVAAAAVLFVAWTLFALAFDAYQWNDENIHLYVADAVAKGARLYADVPSARPPLGILALSGLLATGLAPVLAARLGVIVAMAAIVGSLGAFATRRRNIVAGGLAMCAFLLWSESFGQVSYTIIHWVALGALVATGLLLEGRFVAAGITAGIALGFGQHAGVIVVVGLVFAALRGKKTGALRYGSALTLTCVAVFGLAYAIGGDAFLDDVVRKHLYHVQSDAPAESTGLGWWIGSMAIASLPFIGLGVVVGLLPAPASPRAPDTRSKSKNVAPEPRWYERDGAVLGVLVATHMLAVVGMRGGIYLYFYPCFPLCAWLFGLAGERIVIAIKDSARPRVLGGIVLGAFGLLWLGASFALGKQYSARDQKTYSWLSPTRMLEMARLQQMDAAREIAEHVRAHSTPEQTVFGEPQLASVVALEAGRELAGHYADLAPRWLRSGSVDRRTVASNIEADHVRFFVTPRWFYTKDRYFQAYLRGCYQPPTVYRRRPPNQPGNGIPDLLLFEHKTEPCEVP